MARHPRLTFPGVALHIVQRGNNRNACFRQDGDYLTYLTYLVHLSCALLMRDLGRCYVRYFNRRHGRTGTLWEGRFRSCLVESALYVLACYRYVEWNPVRAAMVDHPSNYPWSSYAGNAGIRADPLITPNSEYLALASDMAGRQATYRGLFEQGLEANLLKSIRESTNGGYAFVSDSFKSTLVLPRGGRIQRGKPGPRVGECEAVYKITTLTPN